MAPPINANPVINNFCKDVAELEISFDLGDMLAPGNRTKNIKIESWSNVNKQEFERLCQVSLLGVETSAGKRFDKLLPRDQLERAKRFSKEEGIPFWLIGPLSSRLNTIDDYGIKQGQLVFYAGAVGFTGIANEEHVLYHERGHHKTDRKIYETHPDFKPYAHLFDSGTMTRAQAEGFLKIFFDVIEKRAHPDNQKLIHELATELLASLDSSDPQKLSQLLYISHELLRYGEEVHWPSTRDFVLSEDYLNKDYVKAIESKAAPLKLAIDIAYVAQAGLWSEYTQKLEELGLKKDTFEAIAQEIRKEVALFRLAIQASSRFFAVPTHDYPVPPLDFLGATSSK